MNLTILTDGGKKFGFGHISRSQTLASHFINNGHETKVLVLSNIDIDNTHFGENIIIDIPYNGDFLLQKIDCNANIIGLDYIGEGELDLVINVHDYSRCKSSNQVSGLEYAIIKEEIIDRVNFDSVDNGRVLIMMGAYDVNNLGHDIVKLLDNQKIQTTIIEKEKNIDITSFDHCVHYEDPDNITDIMFDSSWAVSNGGSSMLELMALGKATHVLPQSDAENALAMQIFNSGGILGVGTPVEVPDAKLITTIGKKARKIIDGHGCKRLMKCIENIVQR